MDKCYWCGELMNSFEFIKRQGVYNKHKVQDITPGTLLKIRKEKIYE